ncbi:MAG: hypothetical protein IJK32_10745 [Bacteroidales bacterium]|nr:hypothetical protein [Bacteroidales bacterium]
MNLRDRIYLTWLNGGWQIILGSVYNISAALLIALSHSYVLAVDVFILKIPFTAIVLYLSHKLSSRDTCFFYINLGFSRWHFQIVVLLADFLLFFILMAIALMFNG